MALLAHFDLKGTISSQLLERVKANKMLESWYAPNPHTPALTPALTRALTRARTYPSPDLNPDPRVSVRRGAR